MNKYASISKRIADRRRRQRSCENKVAFPTAEAARQKGQYFYRCRYCHQFHRTGQDATLAARLSRRFSKSS
jgi:cytochrome c2